MRRSGQSSVEPMLVATGVVIAFLAFCAIRFDWVMSVVTQADLALESSDFFEGMANAVEFLRG